MRGERVVYKVLTNMARIKQWEANRITPKATAKHQGTRFRTITHLHGWGKVQNGTKSPSCPAHAWFRAMASLLAKMAVMAAGAGREGMHRSP